MTNKNKLSGLNISAELLDKLPAEILNELYDLVGNSTAKQYIIEVVSWENDGDNYDTRYLIVSNKKKALEIKKVCEELFRSCNDNTAIGVGNSLCLEGEWLVEEYIEDNGGKIDREYIEFISNKLLGLSEVYDYRVCESVKIHTISLNDEIDNDRKDIFKLLTRRGYSLHNTNTIIELDNYCSLYIDTQEDSIDIISEFAHVVEWLRVNHNIWILIDIDDVRNSNCNYVIKWHSGVSYNEQRGNGYKTPTMAYYSAIADIVDIL